MLTLIEKYIDCLTCNKSFLYNSHWASLL